LEAHQVARQDAIETNLRSFSHVWFLLKSRSTLAVNAGSSRRPCWQQVGGKSAASKRNRDAMLELWRSIVPAEYSRRNFFDGKQTRSSIASTGNHAGREESSEMVQTNSEHKPGQRATLAAQGVCRNAALSRAGIAALEAGGLRFGRSMPAHDPGGGPGI